MLRSQPAGAAARPDTSVRRGECYTPEAPSTSPSASPPASRWPDWTDGVRVGDGPMPGVMQRALDRLDFDGFADDSEGDDQLDGFWPPAASEEGGPS